MANTFKSKVLSATGTTATTLYTVPASTTTTVIGLTVANITAAEISVDVSLWKGGSSQIYIVKNAKIPAGSSLVCVGGEQKVVLETTDLIKVISNTAASADTVLSILEMT